MWNFDDADADADDDDDDDDAMTGGRCRLERIGNLGLDRPNMLQFFERWDFGQTETTFLIWKALKCQLWSGRKFPRLGNIFLGAFDRHIST